MHLSQHTTLLKFLHRIAIPEGSWDKAGFLQAYAQARSNGWGQSFAKAAARSSVINSCFGQTLGFSQAAASADAQVDTTPLPYVQHHAAVGLACSVHKKEMKIERCYAWNLSGVSPVYRSADPSLILYCRGPHF